MRKDVDDLSLSSVSTRRNGLNLLVFNWKDVTHPLAGGAEVYAHEVCKEWVRAGHRVTLFTSVSPGRPTTETIEGINIVRRGGKYSVYRRAKRFYRSHGRGQFDLVIDAVNTRPFGCPSFVKDSPVLAIIHQVAREVWNFEARLPVALIGRFILEPWWLRRYADVPVVTVSESSRDSLVNQYGFRRVTVVPEGASEPVLALAPPVRERHPTVAFVGRLSRSKRPSEALKAFEVLRTSVPGAQMWVIGDGPLEARLRKAHTRNVWFLGKVNEAVKRDRLSRAHAVVATSVREGWGLVVTEAAAVGTPTIAYDVPGLRDSVAASGGILVSADPKDLGETLSRNVPKWAAGDMPTVRASGVVSWRDVAERILHAAVHVSANELESPTSPPSKGFKGSSALAGLE